MSMRVLGYEVAAIRASYEPERRRGEIWGQWLTVLLYRPISFWITPLFLAARLSPLSVTCLGLLLSLLQPLVVLEVHPPFDWALLALIAHVVIVLDCVDGNLARVRGESSPRGAYVDFLADVVFWALFFLSLGLLAARQPGTPAPLRAWAVPLGLQAALVGNVGRTCRDFAERALLPRGTTTFAVPARPLGPRDYALLAFVGWDHLLPSLLLVLGPLGHAWFPLVVASAYAWPKALYPQFLLLPRLSARAEDAATVAPGPPAPGAR